MTEYGANYYLQKLWDFFCSPLLQAHTAFKHKIVLCLRLPILLENFTTDREFNCCFLNCFYSWHTVVFGEITVPAGALF